MKLDISKILETLSKKSKKERAVLMDHTFIFVAGIAVFLQALTNVSTIKPHTIIEALAYPTLPYFIGFVIILCSLPLCKFAVKKFV